MRQSNAPTVAGMTNSPSKPAPALTITILLAALAAALLAPPAVHASERAAAGVTDRCYEARAGKRKTSFGVHQWTARLIVRWCVAGRGRNEAIVSVRRDTRVLTGTNWRLISRSGGVEGEGRRHATAETRLHFRLRYPHFEQNCYPRLALTLHVDGGFERSVSTGC